MIIQMKMAKWENKVEWETEKESYDAALFCCAFLILRFTQKELSYVLHSSQQIWFSFRG